MALPRRNAKGQFVRAKKAAKPVRRNVDFFVAGGKVHPVRKTKGYDRAKAHEKPTKKDREFEAKRAAYRRQEASLQKAKEHRDARYAELQAEKTKLNRMWDTWRGQSAYAHKNKIAPTPTFWRDLDEQKRRVANAERESQDASSVWRAILASMGIK